MAATSVPQPAVIPDRLFFRIGDVARICGVQTSVLRFWETQFSQLRPAKGQTGQRLYRRRDVEMALRIRQLLYGDGYTIAGARQVLARTTLAEPAANDDALDQAAMSPVLDAAPQSIANDEMPRTAAESSAETVPEHPRSIHKLRDELRAIAQQLGEADRQA